MSPHVMRLLIQEAIDRLTEARDRLEAADQRLTDQQPGYPSGHEGSGGDPKTQPERLSSRLGADPAIKDRTRLERDIRRTLAYATSVYSVCVTWSTTQRRKVRKGEGPGDDWCRSCWRNNGHCEPVAHRRYVRYCRFCGDFRAEYRVDPPVELLQLRHMGRRVTARQVADALRRAGVKPQKQAG